MGARLHIVDYKRLMAEKVRFAPLPVVENKEPNRFLDRHGPLNALKSPGRDTY